MEKEFFDKHINVSEAEMLKGAIYGQCRIMDKEDVYNWIYEDELKLKKQKENEQLKEDIKDVDIWNKLYNEQFDKSRKLEQNWNKLKEYAKDNLYFYSGYQGEDLETDIAIQGVLDKMQEIERGISDVED